LIESYIDREQPLDCAGAFKIESLGVLLFEETRGPDSYGDHRVADRCAR
jgi:septum formation protein